MVMKRFTCLTCTLIVACMAAAYNPVGTKQAGKKFLINSSANRVKERNNFLHGESV
jgi:hypothetical protein